MSTEVQSPLELHRFNIVSSRVNIYLSFILAFAFFVTQINVLYHQKLNQVLQTRLRKLRAKLTISTPVSFCDFVRLFQ